MLCCFIIYYLAEKLVIYHHGISWYSRLFGWPNGGLESVLAAHFSLLWMSRVNYYSWFVAGCVDSETSLSCIYLLSSGACPNTLTSIAEAHRSHFDPYSDYMPRWSSNGMYCFLFSAIFRCYLARSMSLDCNIYLWILAISRKIARVSSLKGWFNLGRRHRSWRHWLYVTVHPPALWVVISH